MIRRSLVFLSYYGPEEAASGIRAGRLARSAALAGEDVLFLHGGATESKAVWRDGVRLQSFRRCAIPEFPRRPVRRTLESDHPGRRSAFSRAAAYVTRIVAQPDRFVLSRGRFEERAMAEVAGLRADGFSPVLVVSTPPWSTAQVGTRVARRTGAPLIADLQDLWSANPVAKWPFLGRRRAVRWERAFFGQAAGYLYVNSQIRERFEQQQFPQASRRPSATAPIGFENELPMELVVSPRADLRIGYFGSIYHDRTFEDLLEEILRLPPGLPRVAVHWYGEILGDHPMRSSMQRYTEAGALIVHAPLPFPLARHAMSGCDLLLVVPSPTYPEELTTKFYDYLDAGRPIIALAREGSLLHKLVNGSQTGLTFEPNDRPSIRAFLERAVVQGLRFTPNLAALDDHRLPALSRAITHVLNNLRTE